MAPRKTAKKPTKRATARAARTVRVSTFHRRITIGFLAVSVILILVIIYFALSQVKIFITPQSSQITADFEVELLTDVEGILAGTNIMPGSVVSSLEEVNETITISSGTPVPSVAEGTVTIINNYSQSQPLIRTTRLLTPDGKLFRLSEGVTVPAGGQVQVAVYSDEIGVAYNIGPSTFTIPGLWEGLQDKIYAESSETFTGGERLEKSVTQEVLDASADQVTKRLAQKLKSAEDANADIVQINNVGEATWETDVQVGASVDSFVMTVSVPVTTIRFNKEDLQQIAVNNLIARVPAQEQFVSANLDSLTFELIEIDADGEAANFTASIVGKSASRIEVGDLDIATIKGKTKTELIQHLTSLPAIAEVNVVFIPSWLSKVPSLEDHVYIEIIK